METGFRLGRWTVRPQRGRIDSRDKAIHISPKSMSVLECLARAKGEVVSRNDILDAVWPGADITDDVLTHSVMELRRAFGDSPKDPRVIETIPKVGLRLMLEVSELDELDDRLGRRRASGRNLALVGLLAAVVIIGIFVWSSIGDQGVPPDVGDNAAESSIAVLPFVDLSAEQDQGYLASGLTDEITDRLSQLEGLLVFGPQLAFLFTSTEANQRDDLPQYSAEYLLDGSVRKSGERLRMSVRLVEARNGLQIWSHTFDRPYADLFAVQDEIAAAVAWALRIELGVGDPSWLAGRTSNVAAFEHVMRGNHALDFTPEGIDTALAHYRTAVELDPDYAIGWLRVATVYSILTTFGDRSQADRYHALSNQAMARAQALAPDSPLVLLSAAGRAQQEHNWIAARRLLDQAQAGYGSTADRVLGRIEVSNVDLDMLLKPGHVVELVHLIENVTRVRPLHHTYSSHLPNGYLSLGRLDDALVEIERAYARPRNRWVDSHTGVLIALSIGDEELIRLWLGRAMMHERHSTENSHAAMLERLGDRERALDWLHEAYTSGPNVDDIVIAWAAYYGDTELVLNCMRRSRDLWFFWGPLMADARATGEFKSIVRDIGLVEYWRAYGWNDYCEPLGPEDFECR